MIAEPEVAGELVVLNGKKRGTAIKLRLPITLIGSSEQCDIRISGPGIAEQHAIITHTAIGPVLRAFHTDQTLVNGVIVSTRVLKTRDEVTVGPCVFRLDWTEEQFIPLSVAPVEEETIALWIATPDSEWNIDAREKSLLAQEEHFSKLYQERQTHLTGLVQELASKREEIRQIRAREMSTVIDAQAETEKKQQKVKRVAEAARQERIKARNLYERFSKRMAAERAIFDGHMQAEKHQLAEVRRQLEAEQEQFREERAQHEQTAVAEQNRMRQAWELVQESQRRLIADRQMADEVYHRQLAALESREGELAHQLMQAANGQKRVEKRVQELLAEIQRLEQRAGVSRQVVQQLEEKRTLLESTITDANSTTALISVSAVSQIVPLHVDPSRNVEEFLTSLAIQERDFARNQQNIVYAQQELERQAAELHDQRVVVAEQLGELLVARQSWQSAQMLALQELEEMALGLDERERMLQLHVNDYHLLDQARRKKEEDLISLRHKLEAWQLQLMTHEAEVSNARAAQDAELQQRRECLTQSEEALTQLRQQWAKQMDAAIQPLQVEAERWSVAREELVSKLGETEQLRERLLQDSARVAELSLAVEQAQQELFGSAVGALAERRIRVFRKYWERHFQTAFQQINAQQRVYAAIEQAATTKMLQQAADRILLAKQQQQLLQIEQQLEQEKLTHERRVDEASRVLNIAEARASRSEEALQRIRAEAHRVTEKLGEREYTALPGWGQKRAA